MTEPVRTRETASDRSDGVFGARVRLEPPHHVIELFGELDITSGADAERMCTLPDRLHVLVDLSGLVFMDCAGYGALVAAASSLERRGGSLALVNPVGEPRRLLDLIGSLLPAGSGLDPRSAPLGPTG